MKKFPGTITVIVPIQTIADQLLDTFPTDYKHRELLTETIVETAVMNKTLSYIYNSLNGFTGQINFAVGDSIISTEEVSDWDVDKSTWKNVPVTGVIEEINIYRPEKIKVRRKTINREGKESTAVDWYDHTKATKIAEVSTNEAIELQA